MGGEYDTRQLVLGIARRHVERARFLNYGRHAVWVVADGRACITEAVLDLFKRIVPEVVELAGREAAELRRTLGRDIPGVGLAAWDWEHYAAKQSATEAVDPVLLRPYLECYRVLHKSVFVVMTVLHGITFCARSNLRGLTPDSEVYEVHEADGIPLGAAILDPFTRPTKRDGTRMTLVVDQSDLTGSLPAMTNTCSFTRPAGGTAYPLTWDNVITMLYEFGHVLHGLFSGVKYPSCVGTAVPRDFVEFPSQVNELWMWDETLISRFAVHHETGKPLPAGLVTRLWTFRSTGEGHHILKLVTAMLLDQTWHTTVLGELSTSVEELEPSEATTLERAGVAHELVPPRYRFCYFSHVFGGGYTAVYYGCLWIKVMDTDICTRFTDSGSLCRSASEHLRRELLGRGGGIEPMQAWHNFCRVDPDMSRLLRRKGLSVEQRRTTWWVGADVGAGEYRGATHGAHIRRYRVQGIRPRSGHEPVRREHAALAVSRGRPPAWKPDHCVSVGVHSRGFADGTGLTRSGQLDRHVVDLVTDGPNHRTGGRTESD